MSLSTIAVYSKRAVSSQISSALNKLTAAAPNANPASQPATQPALITFSLEGVTKNTGSNPIPLAPRSPASPGRIPQVPAAVPGLSVLSTLYFDNVTSDTTNGATQSVQLGFPARQTVHQVASGYYVDGFGLGPGSFTIQIITPHKGDIADRVQQFKYFLDNSKLSNPLSPAYPPIIRYNNLFDGTAYLLTQARLDMSYSADRPGMLIVTITADILCDYNSTQSGSQQAALATATSSTTQTVTSTSALSFTPAVTSTQISGGSSNSGDVVTA